MHLFIYVIIFKTLTYMQTRFRHQNKPLYRNEINKVNQLQLNYFTNIHLLIPRFMKSLCYNHKTKYTDRCPIPNNAVRCNAFCVVIRFFHPRHKGQ